MINIFTNLNEFRATSFDFVDGSAVSEKYMNEHETMAHYSVTHHSFRSRGE